MKNLKIEVCAASVQSALNAQSAGAHRIELCSALELGGITPSAATIELTLNQLDIDIMVLIRPRPGDFHYSKLEIENIKRDILFCKNLSSKNGKKIKGVVLGLLEKNGAIDFQKTKDLVKLASPMEVTFHRAFDRCRDPFLALEKIIDAGATRILTSGQQPTALQGQELLRQLVEKAKDRIIILPGAGINAENILEIMQTTHANEIHFSAKSLIKSPMKFVNDWSENNYFESDEEKIKAVLSKMKKGEPK